jgi:hypothetical protein
MIKQWRMIMLCGSIAVSVETILEMMVGIKQSPLSIVVTSFNVAMIFTLYKPELKELIDKFKGDGFNGGNFG